MVDSQAFGGYMSHHGGTEDTEKSDAFSVAPW